VWKKSLVISVPLIALWLVIYAMAGHRYTWREWASLPFADPGGFGMFLIVALLVTVALAMDQRRRRR
jgi:hypothetical protein